LIAFFDASALIYFIEGREPFAARLKSRLGRLAEQQPNLGAGVSRLTWLECRVGPMKANDSALIERYDRFFAQPSLQWVELSQDVVELAAAIRVRHGLRTPDALQAACALQLGDQHQFLTGDRAFRRVAGLQVALLA
jgi:predicted nucleic acid-binding protein